MVVDGYDLPLTLAVTLVTYDGTPTSPTSPISRYGITVPLDMEAYFTHAALVHWRRNCPTLRIACTVHRQAPKA